MLWGSLWDPKAISNRFEMLVGELTLLLGITALSVTSIGTTMPMLVLGSATALKIGGALVPIKIHNNQDHLL